MSMRYGIGVGKAGFSWSGNATIRDKQEWPKWFPPKEMQQRDLRAWFNAKGMEGGSRNPLGARALYLFEGKCNGNNTRTAACKDTLYRLHGTSDENSIGKAVSSGCIRLLNQDIIDLYERVPLGTKVVVLKGTEPPPTG
jgi:lipoprotein-anchoring transpeptidase ErfK/SrfK